MTATQRPFVRVIERAEAGARRDTPLDVASRSVAERASMQRFVQAAREYVAANPRRRSFRHHGRIFRLHSFDGWFVVLTWRGLPIVGPLRVRKGGAA